MVGLAGLEPATFRPPDGRATRLRHSPPCLHPNDWFFSHTQVKNFLTLFLLP